MRETSFSPDDNDYTLKQYLKEVTKVRLLTPQEEYEIAGKIAEGSQSALNLLIKSNLRFVVTIAKQYKNHGTDLIDLISEGNVGLIKAATSFDQTRGFRFISYAVWFIRQNIINSISSYSRIVKLPVNQISLVNKVNRSRYNLIQELEREPSIYELVEHTGLSEEAIIDILYIDNRYNSLDEMLPKSGDSDGGKKQPLGATIKNENSEEASKRLDHDESLSIELNRVLNTLPDKEAQILRLSFGIGIEYAKSLEEVSNIVGLTKERTRQIKEKAIRKLKHSSRNHLLKEFIL